MIFSENIVKVKHFKLYGIERCELSLKPCPFCGSEAKLVVKDWDNKVDEYRIECTKCEASFRFWCNNPMSAARYWNERILYGDTEDRSRVVGIEDPNPE